MKEEKDRFAFYLGRDPVGCFLGEDYPMAPGRYRYDPYRGQGHYLFQQALRRGAVACHFCRQGMPFSILLLAEEFVEGEWFVQVGEVRRRAWLRHALGVVWRETVGRIWQQVI
jgi:hypothetical protein